MEGYHSQTLEGVIDGVGFTSTTEAIASEGVLGRATATSGVVYTAGVRSINRSASGTGYGVLGQTVSDNTDAAAVVGASSGGAAAVLANGRVDIHDVGAMAWLSSDQTIASGTVTTVAYDSTKRDDFNGFDESTGVYTVQVPGDYIVEWQLDWLDSFNTETVQYRLAVNGSSNAPGFLVDHTETGEPVRNFSKPVWSLDTGDTIEVLVYQTTGSGKAIEGYLNYHDTFMSIRKFG